MPSSDRLNRCLACVMGALALPLVLVLSAPMARAGDGGTPREIGDASTAETRPAKRDTGPISSTPPDPPAMRERRQWIFDLRYEKGEVFLLGVHRVELPESQETPRAMGRFALELFEGPTLVERVRFDFPLLGAGENLDGGYATPPSFERKLSTRIGVLFPATFKGTRLELWDRSTNKRFNLPWPPDETRRAPRDTTDGGKASPATVAGDADPNPR